MSFPEVKKAQLFGCGLNINVNVGHLQTMKPRKCSLTSVTTKFTPFFPTSILSSILFHPFLSKFTYLVLSTSFTPSSLSFSIVFHPLCGTWTRFISPAGQIFLRPVCDGLNLSLSSRRNKQKPKTKDRGQLCPVAQMSGAGREQLQRPKQRTAWEQTACYGLKKGLKRPHEMHSR